MTSFFVSQLTRSSRTRYYGWKNVADHYGLQALIPKALRSLRRYGKSVSELAWRNCETRSIARLGMNSHLSGSEHAFPRWIEWKLFDRIRVSCPCIP
jgi:hypothetical protein